MAIRQQLGHTGLPDFVGDIDDEAPYRRESSPALSKEPKAVVVEFWERMQTNNFSYAAELFADDYVCDWPLTNERIRGRDNFAALNAAYPTHGQWTFTIHRCVAEGDTVVTEITVTDGLQQGQAITFSTVNEGAITNQVEYWPEAYAAPAWRQAYAEVLNEAE